MSKAHKSIRKKLKRKGAVTGEEKRVALVMVLTLFSWIFLSKTLGLANIALLSSVLLFALKVMEWRDVEDYVNWGVILMYGGAISLGSALVSTGATRWLTDILLSDRTLTPISFLIVLSLFSIFLTEGVSNTAAVAIILPIGFSAGDALGINPLATVFIVAVPSGLAFTLPIATPPNAIAYSSGYYEITDILKPGLILNIVSWIVFILVARTYWPMIGLNLT